MASKVIPTGHLGFEITCACQPHTHMYIYIMYIHGMCMYPIQTSCRGDGIIGVIVPAPRQADQADQARPEEFTTDDDTGRILNRLVH